MAARRESPTEGLGSSTQQPRRVGVTAPRQSQGHASLGTALGSCLGPQGDPANGVRLTTHPGQSGH